MHIKHLSLGVLLASLASLSCSYAASLGSGGLKAMFENVNRAARDELRSTFHNGQSSTQGFSRYVPNSDHRYLPSTSREHYQGQGSSGSLLRLSDASKQSIRDHLNLAADVAYLRRIRLSIYRKLNVKIDEEHDQATIPYRGHLDSQQLAEGVAGLSVRQHPSLWEMDGKRFLLKKENRNAKFMDTAFNFRSQEHHKSYMSVWQELEDKKDTWRLLGLVKLPSPRKLPDLRREVFTKSPYPVNYYMILDGSSFRRTG